MSCDAMRSPEAACQHHARVAHRGKQCHCGEKEKHSGGHAIERAVGAVQSINAELDSPLLRCSFIPLTANTATNPEIIPITPEMMWIGSGVTPTAAPELQPL